MGNYHLYATVALHVRGDKRKPSNFVKEKQVIEKKQHQRATDGKPTSYANAVKTNLEPIGFKTTPKIPDPELMIPNELLICVDDQPLKVLVELKDPKVITNITTLCKEEGFEIDVRYFGGRWILMQFLSLATVNGFKENETLRNLINNIKEVSNQFVLEERLFGEMLFLEDEDQYALSSRRVCIAFKHKKSLDEAIKVKILGDVYEVKIKVIQEWEAEIDKNMDRREDGQYSIRSDDESDVGDQNDEYEDVRIETHTRH
ncbi:hypothetical protein LXL04_002941 [Taraxacum kok-saghyz]